jgi:hypothetical protein
MRTLLTIVAVCALVVVLTAGAIVALAIELLPYIVVGFVIAALMRSRGRRRDAAARPLCRPAPAVPPQGQVEPGGWVYVPVWVGPRPRTAMPVIDAEVIEDPRRE